MRLPNWFKRKPKPKPMIIKVPKEHIMELLERWDELTSAPENRCARVRYVFWNMALKYCPDLKGKNWTFQPLKRIVPYFKENLK